MSKLTVNDIFVFAERVHITLGQQVETCRYLRIEFDPETNLYVGTIPSIPGAHTQGATLDELHSNLKEVLALCLEELGDFLADLPRFVGVQQVEVAL